MENRTLKRKVIFFYDENAEREIKVLREKTRLQFTFDRTIKKLTAEENAKLVSIVNDWIDLNYITVMKVGRSALIENAKNKLEILADKFPYSIENMGKDDVPGDNEKNYIHGIIDMLEDNNSIKLMKANF